MATLTPEAKQLLSRTIRALRERLLRDLDDDAERRYRLSLPLERAKLPEHLRKKRDRLDAWLEERVRTTNPKNKNETEAARARFLAEALKDAAATLVNRLVLLRHLEALGLSKPAVVTGGWNSKAYSELREFAPALCGDDTEGYATTLQLVFDELALDLPGLFGDVGLTRLFPIPPATLRDVVQALDDPGLESAWTDDTTLGWVYQYWNDPEREALDGKLNDGGKIEPHEIASKTQMFTERYMVEWLLQNSLGLTWLCMCRKHGWTADAERVLPVLDARRAEWRKRRDAGEVALDALMSIDGELEEHWKYYVPQPIPEDAVARAPDSIRSLKLLDPACGSGHFLVIAFDLLAAMYREEARHRGEQISDREIAESILENNLHGIDIDPRAVQIAAAAVVLKAKRIAPNARPKRLNLVAPVLRLSNLNEDDPAFVRLRHELRAEARIPEELTNRLVKSLAGVDHLGSLLKVDAAIDDAIREQERVENLELGQGDLLSGRFPARQAQIDWNATRATLLDRLEGFLAQHKAEEDLGLRLDGEQLAAGVRFVRIAKEATYDLVVANPPFQGVEKLANPSYIKSEYPATKADMYSTFIARCLQFARVGGTSAFVSLRGWLYLGVFEDLRLQILRDADLRCIGDLGAGAFESLGGGVVASNLCVVRKSPPSARSVAIRLDSEPAWGHYAGPRAAGRRAGLLVQAGAFSFATTDMFNVAGAPLVYWWSTEFLARYASSPKLGEVAPAKMGMATSDNTRFLRAHWEVRGPFGPMAKWAPYIKGGEGREWFEPLSEVIRWFANGLEVKVFNQHLYGSFSRKVQNEAFFFRKGIAFTLVGDRFLARAHRYPSVIDGKGSSVFPESIAQCLALMNSGESKFTLESLNPTVNFQVVDVNRLAITPVEHAERVYRELDAAFSEHESARESSVEVRAVARSPWRYAQEWAQRTVDQPTGEPLPPYEPQYDPPEPVSFVSFAVGLALGRFAAGGEGILDESAEAGLPLGILYVSAASEQDSLAHPGCTPLLAAWAEHGSLIGGGDDLRTWLRTSFFKHHKVVYENRPIYFPLSSAKKNFVVWVSIHRWAPSTLATVLADHLIPERRRLEGELDDLRQARANVGRGGKASAERRFADVQKLLAELGEFIEVVIQCAERGPPPTSPGEPKREVDARYEMDLDDGVMVNSSALWPLLEPQWKDPKKWWNELASAKGRKDYDWSHLAKRYFPSRVEAKCVEDPSLAVAHGCFWRLHPAKAYAWELRLQDEIRSDFTIDEPGSGEARARFVADHPEDAHAIQTKEAERRGRKARKTGHEDENLSLELADSEADEEQAEEAV